MTETAPAQQTTIALGGETFTVLTARPAIALFWQKANSGRWEADTLRFVRTHAGADAVFVDVGAWIGPISLVAARLMGKVIALEPDPVAHGELTHNVRANGATNVEVWHAGIDAAAGTLALHAPDGLGMSVTSALGRSAGTAGSTILVRTVSFDEISAALPKGARVVAKVDIEGHEYAILDHIIAFARRHAAPLHLSLHPRSYFTHRRATVGAIAARLETWKVTRDVITRLAVLGPVHDAGTGRPLTTIALARYLLTQRRVKNFTIEIEGAARPA